MRRQRTHALVALAGAIGLFGGATGRGIVGGSVWGEPAAAGHRAPPAARPEPCGEVHVIGDSLLAGNDERLALAFIAAGEPLPRLDAAVARGIENKREPDIRTGLEAVAWLRETYGDADCWVVALGTNDAFYVPVSRYRATLGSILDSIGRADHNIWLVEVAGREPNARFAEWNRSIAEWVARDGHIRRVPWADPASAHPEWFGTDGIHLTVDGTRGRVALIARAIADYAVASCIPAITAEPATGFYPAVRERFRACPTAA